MNTIHGFELVQEEEIVELNTKAQLFRHVKSGAELLSLQNDDENKVFGIAFRTPPPDSTGVPHIMEHAVLGGSRKYRVKEPFVELVKGSLNTFVNAMTSSDKTTYPVASQNLQDFYNLVDVYLDAVFYPLLTPYHLQQEGWHYELEDVDAPLLYKGIVFNEMKGAYSSPDDLLYRRSQQSLFPGNAYGLDSGGDPKVMPDLTYEQFKAFHKTYYHPSNARILFYGDDPPQKRLRILNEYLKDFEKAEIDSTIALHPLFSEPRRFTYSYGVDSEADTGKKGYVQMNWLLPENDAQALTMALSILSYALVSSSASPLRKALIDSGLGEDVTGGGLSTAARQMTFSVGLKGIATADVAKVETLTLDTLQKLAAEGFEKEMVEAAVNTIEFRLRENNTGRYPRGLVLMFSALSTWLYDGDPFAPLAYEAPLTAVKTRLQEDPGYLQELLRAHLLQNPHRTTVVLEPDPELDRREEAAEKEKLAQIRAGMSRQERQAIVDNTRELKRRQETPDSPAALATLPRLTLDDLDKENKLIPLAVSTAHDSQILYHDLFTNGIVYLDLGFNLQVLPQELLPYVPLFGTSLLQMGTEEEDYVKLLQRIGRKTGGISTARFISTIRDRDENSAWFILRGKATADQVHELLAILRDVLLTVKLDNQERFRQLVLRAKAGKEAGLVPGGHSVIHRRLQAHMSTSGWAAEQMGGIDYLFFLRQLAHDVDHNWPGVLQKLEEVRHLLLNRNGMICNVTLDDENWRHVEPQLSDFLTELPHRPVSLAQWKPDPFPAHEGLTIPAQVNYVGKGANLYELGYELDGSIAVITKYLRTTWLWEKVRAQGGAYGAFCAFARQSGILNFVSYRDPNLLDTLTNYDQTADFLRRLELSEDELVKSIIGAISDIDAYQLPDAKGYTSMIRYLLEQSDEERQRFRDEVLSTTTADFKAFADVLHAVTGQGRVVVLGSQDAITAANEKHNGWLQVTKVM